MEGYVLFIIGVVLGSVITNIILNIRSLSGTLRVDHSDPEKDVYRFDIDNIDKLSKSKRVIIKVDNHAHLSQE